MNLEELIQDKLPEGANLLFVTKFGSHLYGTDTPESDLDYKGVYMPSIKQICLGTIKNSINNNRKKSEGERNAVGDVDFELYSLHYFLHLACEGETAALDMLHAEKSNDCVYLTSGIWDAIQAQRTKFYTRNLKAFIGYARKQAAKYGIKGSRLAAAKGVLDLLWKQDDKEAKLGGIWHELPENEHARHIADNPNGINQYQICGKILQSTQTVGYTTEILTRFYNNYGDRALKAERNEGIDWKAVSHALRAAYQLREILVDGTITYPLVQANFLRNVKLGKLHYKNEVADILEDLMAEIEILSEKSTLPETVDHDYWDQFLMEAVLKKIKHYV